MAEKDCNKCKKTSIGGQALIEGIMMRGPEKTAMAVRNPQNEMVVEEWENSIAKKPKYFRIPLIRGVFNFIDSMKLGYKCLMRSAEIAMPEETEADKKSSEGNSALWNTLMAVAAVLGVAISIVLFMWLPNTIGAWLAKPFPALGGRVLKGICEGVLRIIIFIAYLLLVSLMKDIRRTFQYHGAEHKTIFCYEAGLELTVENVRPMKRFHPRCGTSFMILMLLVGIIISILIPPMPEAWATWLAVLVRTAIKIVLIPLTVGIGYELIKFCGRHDNLFTKIISKPGVWLQHVTVFEPDDSMIECAIAALKKVIPEDSEKDNW